MILVWVPLMTTKKLSIGTGGLRNKDMQKRSGILRPCTKLAKGFLRTSEKL